MGQLRNAGHPVAAEDVVLPTVGDELAPDGVAITPDALEFGPMCTSALAVTGYPRTVPAGVLERLIDSEEPMDIAMHLTPQPSAAVVRRLSHRLTQLHASRLVDERRGQVGRAEQAVAYTDVQTMRDKVQRGDEKILRTSITLRAVGTTRPALDARTERVRSLFESAGLVTRRVRFEQGEGFRTCLPEGVDYLGRGISLDTTSLAMLFPFTTSQLPLDPGGLLYGATPNGSLVLLDPFSTAQENANHILFAKSGAGKSYFCKVLMLRALLEGIQVIVIDPEDEYARLCPATGGTFLALSATSPVHLNPFDLPQSATNDDVLREKITALHALLDILLAERGPHGHGTLTQREKSLLDAALFETYRQAGITVDPTSRARPAPLMKDLLAVLQSGECGVDETHLATRLQRYVTGSLSGLFAGPTTVDLTDPLVVFGVRHLDSELRPVGLYLIAEHVATCLRDKTRPRLLFIDEAWTLMQFQEGARFVADLARRCRKYYLGLVTVTQNPEDLLKTEEGRTVVQQASIKLLLKQDATTIEAVVSQFGLSTAERHTLISAAKGEGICFARNTRVPFQVIASKEEHSLATTDPRELAAIPNQPDSAPVVAGALPDVAMSPMPVLEQHQTSRVDDASSQDPVSQRDDSPLVALASSDPATDRVDADRMRVVLETSISVDVPTVSPPRVRLERLTPLWTRPLPSGCQPPKGFLRPERRWRRTTTLVQEAPTPEVVEEPTVMVVPDPEGPAPDLQRTLTTLYAQWFPDEVSS